MQDFRHYYFFFSYKQEHVNEVLGFKKNKLYNKKLLNMFDYKKKIINRKIKDRQII